MNSLLSWRILPQGLRTEVPGFLLWPPAGASLSSFKPPVSFVPGPSVSQTGQALNLW